MALIQPAQVAEWLGWSPDKITERQADLERISESASISIRRFCGRAFEPANGETRTFNPGVATSEYPVGDIRSATQVQVRYAPTAEYRTLTSGQYELMLGPRRDWPFQTIARVDGRYFYPGINALRITGDWEFETVPDSVAQAAIMLSANLLSRAQSPKKVGTSFTGSEVDLGSFYDFDIMELVNDYKLATGQVG